MVEKQDYFELLEALLQDVPYFLERWSLRMEKMGYLQHTTAKHADCKQALKDFVTILQKHWLRDDFVLDFTWLLQQNSSWAQSLVMSARKHRMRGITVHMYLGCFKTFIQSIMDCLEKKRATPAQTLLAIQHVALYADALELLFLQDWMQLFPELAEQKLEQTNRLLTLEKCRLENLFNATSELIFYVDAQGVVTNVNAAVRELFSLAHVLGKNICCVLSMQQSSMEHLLEKYTQHTLEEIRPKSMAQVFKMAVAGVQTVSMACNEYIVILTDISAHVSHRELLERTVQERTDALQQEKEHLQEMNITLRTVLQSIEKERLAILEDIAKHVQTVVLPFLDRIPAEEDVTVRESYVNLVKEQLVQVTQGKTVHHPGLLALSHVESKVCHFIQSGKSSKDIAHILNISVETVQTHRKNIRRKLHLHGKNINLYAHLKSLSFTL